CAPQAAPGAPWLSAGAAAALARLQAAGLGGAEAALSPAIGREARDALAAFIEHHLGRRLAARRFLDEIGPLLGD
ncbi:DNA repair protein RecO C-terminal domain-containing protein, partial [Anaeromyxobacter sp. SG66]